MKNRTRFLIAAFFGNGLSNHATTGIADFGNVAADDVTIVNGASNRYPDLPTELDYEKVRRRERRVFPVEDGHKPLRLLPFPSGLQFSLL
jgi:hypothetical protein